MNTILCTNKYEGDVLDLARAELPGDFELIFLREQTEECLIKTIADADYLLAGGRLVVSSQVLDNARKLKMIQRSGVGLDALDLDAIAARELPLYVNPGVNAESVAEFALLLILACLRRLTEINENTKNGVWEKQKQGIRTFELRGKTVGLIGMGRVSKIVVRLLSAFGSDVIYNDVIRAPEDFEEMYSLDFVSREELFERADIISLHCALTDETRNIVCAETIARMKPGVVLVNTARGALVDENALADALECGQIAFAGLDVHEIEPIPAASALNGFRNVILTPHIAGVSRESFRAMMRGAFRNIECFENGELEKIEKFRYI